MSTTKNDLRKFAPFLLSSSKKLTINNLDLIYSKNELLDFCPFEIVPNAINQFDRKDNGGVEYLVLPSWNNPRFFVYNDKILIKNIGNLIKPTSFKAKLAWDIALFLNRFNAIKLIFRNSIFIKTDILGKHFLKTKAHTQNKFVIYTGAVGIYQKWTIQEMDEINNIVSFTKIGKSELSIKRIEKEHENLEWLSEKVFNSFEVPQELDYFNVDSFVFLKQTACKKEYKRINSEFTHLHKNVLSELHYNFQKETISGLFISSLCKEADKLKKEDVGVQPTVSLLNENIKWLEKELSKTSNLILTFSHGDFTQWNNYSDGQKLFVFDWEMGDYRMPLWDYFNFIYHSAFLVYNCDVSRLEKMLHDNYEWAISIAGNRRKYDIYHKTYLIEITLHYLHQYQILKELEIRNSVYLLIKEFPKYLRTNNKPD